MPFFSRYASSAVLAFSNIFFTRSCPCSKLHGYRILLHYLSSLVDCQCMCFPFVMSSSGYRFRNMYILAMWTLAAISTGRISENVNASATYGALILEWGTTMSPFPYLLITIYKCSYIWFFIRMIGFFLYSRRLLHEWSTRINVSSHVYRSSILLVSIVFSSICDKNL